MPRDDGGREEVTQLQAKDCLDGWPPPAADPGSASTLILNFWPPEL